MGNLATNYDPSDISQTDSSTKGNYSYWFLTGSFGKKRQDEFGCLGFSSAGLAADENRLIQMGLAGKTTTKTIKDTQIIRHMNQRNVGDINAMIERGIVAKVDGEKSPSLLCTCELKQTCRWGRGTRTQQLRTREAAFRTAANWETLAALRACTVAIAWTGSPVSLTRGNVGSVSNWHHIPTQKERFHLQLNCDALMELRNL